MWLRVSKNVSTLELWFHIYLYTFYYMNYMCTHQTDTILKQTACILRRYFYNKLFGVHFWLKRTNLLLLFDSTIVTVHSQTFQSKFIRVIYYCSAILSYGHWLSVIATVTVVVIPIARLWLSSCVPGCSGSASSKDCILGRRRVSMKIIHTNITRG